MHGTRYTAHFHPLLASPVEGEETIAHRKKFPSPGGLSASGGEGLGEGEGNVQSQATTETLHWNQAIFCVKEVLWIK